MDRRDTILDSLDSIMEKGLNRIPLKPGCLRMDTDSGRMEHFQSQPIDFRQWGNEFRSFRYKFTHPHAHHEYQEETA